MPVYIVIPEQDYDPALGARLAGPSPGYLDLGAKITAASSALAVEAWARRSFELAERDGEPAQVASGLHYAVELGAGEAGIRRVRLAVQMTFDAETEPEPEPQLLG